MKKLLLSAALTAFAAAGANASLTIVNNTPCSYTASINGGVGIVTIAPNSVTPYTQTPTGAKVVCPGGNSQVDVQNTPSGYMTASSADPAVSCFPACNGGSAYTVTWIVTGSGDIVMMIS